jgi:hypothetical protein
VTNKFSEQLLEEMAKEESLLVTPSVLAKEILELRSLCAEFYIIFGHLDAPAVVLDQAVAAASGWELPHGTLIPYPEMIDKYTPVPEDK